MSRKTVLTKQGLDLLAKAQTGAVLHFTRAVLGDGTVAEDADLKSMTAMVNEKLTLPISNITTSGTGIATIETQLENAKLEHGFFAREVGIFASIDADGTDGEEVLYAYRNTGDDSEYVPAGGGSEIWNLTYNIITIIDNAENITATISGDVVYVSAGTFNSHKDSDNPHPNFMQVGGKVDSFDYLNCGFSKAGDKLNRISLDKARLQILGGDLNALPLMNSRISQLERENANLALQLESEGMMPDCNMLLAENFMSPDSIDQLEVKVTSAAAGDDSIDVESNEGFIIGSWYWITDGVHAEYIQVRSVIKNGNVYRIIATQKLQETYSLDSTKIYRTTAWITTAGEVYGSGDVVGTNYMPGKTWEGAISGGSADSNEALGLSLDKAGNFTVSGKIVFTEV